MTDTDVIVDETGDVGKIVATVTEDATVVVVPLTGEVIRLDDPAGLYDAVEHLRDVETRMREVKGQLVDALVELSMVNGSKTFLLDDGRKVALSSNDETRYDAEAIERDLRAAGMPDWRIREIVVETVTYTVKAVEAQKAARSNPAFAEVIERHKTVTHKRPSVGKA